MWQSGSLLLYLIMDILDFSKIKEKELRLNISIFKLDEVISESNALFK